LFGTYAVTEAFVPQLTRSRRVVVNNLSLNSLAPLPVLAAYSVSKAAAFSLTQSLRASLAERGVRVHAVLTGPTDTDMVRDLDIPKASPGSVARTIFDAVDRGEEDIFPNPLAQSLADGWRNGAVKAFERQLSEIASALDSRAGVLPGPGPGVRTAAAHRRAAAVRLGPATSFPSSPSSLSCSSCSSWPRVSPRFQTMKRSTKC
jgi:NAD(P)-dependent dehydrogenase (short-subunit alcohol dehydrogenase family)